MVGVLFVKLENFLDYEKRLIELPIEPYGTLYIEVSLVKCKIVIDSYW